MPDPWCSYVIPFPNEFFKTRANGESVILYDKDIWRVKPLMKIPNKVNCQCAAIPRDKVFRNLD